MANPYSLAEFTADLLELQRQAERAAWPPDEAALMELMELTERLWMPAPARDRALTPAARVKVRELREALRIATPADLLRDRNDDWQVFLAELLAMLGPARPAPSADRGTEPHWSPSVRVGQLGRLLGVSRKAAARSLVSQSIPNRRLNRQSYLVDLNALPEAARDRLRAPRHRGSR